ncbi:MAG: hypothetical protein IJ679_05160 [Lachnospiraceae bacterium]|nr:hypothetical protein [Lachnospiraceae bacterium]
MNYDIHITRAAEKDLNSAADYIEFVLLNPQAADNVISEENHTVYIVRFLCEKRDWITILKQGFSLK